MVSSNDMALSELIVFDRSIAERQNRKVGKASLAGIRSRAGRSRSPKGSVLALGVLCFSLLLIAVLIPSLRLAQIFILQARETKALEAASLAAVGELSRIVVDDPYFGYIALVDSAACGRATTAGDGEPLPVLGINTLWSTLREEVLFAQLTDNDDLQEFAKYDLQQAQRATKQLQDILTDSLREKSRFTARDADGVVITPYSRARSIYLQNGGAAAPDAGNGSTFALSLGWLDDLTSSQTAIPQPAKLAQVNEEEEIGANYRAGVDVPVKDLHFFFASFSPKPTLGDPGRFMNPDAKRVCSVVRAQSILSARADEQRSLLSWLGDLRLSSQACAIPAFSPDTNLPGILRISFSEGLVPELTCVRDLLTRPELGQSKGQVYRALGGDYPGDRGSSLAIARDHASVEPFTRIVARGLFDWLRRTRGKTRLDALSQMLDAPFANLSATGSGSKSAPSFLYELDNAGYLLLTNERQSAFLSEIVSENQLYAVVDNIHMSSGDLTVMFRDLVNQSGAICGGRHGGEPVAGDPINWCELPSYDGAPATASLKNEGSLSRGIIAAGTPQGCPDPSAVSLKGLAFRRSDSAELSVQPRKNYYSSGLAVELRFSAPAVPIDRG